MKKCHPIRRDRHRLRVIDGESQVAGDRRPPRQERGRQGNRCRPARRRSKNGSANARAGSSTRSPTLCSSTRVHRPEDTSVARATSIWGVNTG